MPDSRDPLIERRTQDPYLALMHVILKKTEALQETAVKVELLGAKLDEHVRSNEAFQGFLQQTVKDAFLDGDVLLHKEEHKVLRARAQLCKKFFENLLERLGQGTLFALLGVLGALILYWWNGQIPPKH